MTPQKAVRKQMADDQMTDPQASHDGSEVHRSLDRPIVLRIQRAVDGLGEDVRVVPRQPCTQDGFVSSLAREALMVKHAQPRDLLDPHGLRVRPHRASADKLVHRLEALLLLLGSPSPSFRLHLSILHCIEVSCTS